MDKIPCPYEKMDKTPCPYEKMDKTPCVYHHYDTNRKKKPYQWKMDRTPIVISTTLCKKIDINLCFPWFWSGAWYGWGWLQVGAVGLLVVLLPAECVNRMPTLSFMALDPYVSWHFLSEEVFLLSEQMAAQGNSSDKVSTSTEPRCVFTRCKEETDAPWQCAAKACFYGDRSSGADPISSFKVFRKLITGSIRKMGLK